MTHPVLQTNKLSMGIRSNELLNESKPRVELGRAFDRRIRHENSHPHRRTVCFKSRDIGNPRRKAGDNSLEIVRQKITTISIWTQADQLLVTRNRMQLSEQSLE